MQAAAELDPQVRYWAGAPGTQQLKFVTELRSEEPEHWKFNPFEFFVLPPQHEVTEIQQRTVDKIINRFTSPDLGNRLVAVPTKDQPGNHPKIAIRIGPGKIDEYTDPRPLKELPDLPLIILLNVVDHLPDSVAGYHEARQQLIRTNSQNGAIIEVNPKTGLAEKAVWMSTQGNRQKVTKDIYGANFSDEGTVILGDNQTPDMEIHPIEGTEKDIIDNIVLRAIVHSADEPVTTRGDALVIPSELTWDNWIKHPVHDELHFLAQELNNTKVESSIPGDTQEWVVLDDDVPLYQYVDLLHKINVKIDLEIMHREGLGEGMYFMYVPELGIVAVTPSGPHKVIWDKNPARKLFLSSVTHRLPNGYLIGRPSGIPEDKEFDNSSVETAETIDALHVLQLIVMGVLDNYPDFKRWQQSAFKQYNGAIPVRLPGSPDLSLAGVHAHISQKRGVPIKGGSERVRPDYNYIPGIDMACGMNGGTIATASALFKSRLFRAAAKIDYNSSDWQHPFGDAGVINELDGHGIIAYAATVRKLLNVIRNHMTAVRPAHSV